MDKENVTYIYIYIYSIQLCIYIFNRIYTQLNIQLYRYIYSIVHVYNWILFSRKKEWNFVICNNIDGLGGYYA